MKCSTREENVASGREFGRENHSSVTETLSRERHQYWVLDDNIFGLWKERKHRPPFCPASPPAAFAFSMRILRARLSSSAARAGDPGRHVACLQTLTLASCKRGTGVLDPKRGFAANRKTCRRPRQLLRRPPPPGPCHSKNLYTTCVTAREIKKCIIAILGIYSSESAKTNPILPVKNVNAIFNVTRRNVNAICILNCTEINSLHLIPLIGNPQWR